MNTRGKFVRDFIVQYLAAVAATDSLSKPSIDKAIFLANQMWNESKELRAYLSAIEDYGGCGII